MCVILLFFKQEAVYEGRLSDWSSEVCSSDLVRMDYAAQEGGDANVRAVFTGQAGKGRVTETAGVRGLDESTLKSASFDAGELKAMEGNRVTPEAAASHARAQGWDATRFTYEAEADTGKRGGASPSEKRGGLSTDERRVGKAGGSALTTRRSADPP